MPTIWRKTGGSWTKVKTIYRKTGGSWQTVKRVWRKSGGTWQLVFLGPITPSISTQVEISASTPSSPNYTVALTGTLYHWNNSTGVTYQFTKSTNGSSYSNISGASGTSTNPASGSSNTSDSYTLLQADVAANTTNYYQYVSKAVNSTYGTEQTSTSYYVTIEGCRDITNLSATQNSSTSMDLSWTASVYAGRQQVLYKTNAASTWTTFGGVSGTATSVTVTGLTASTSYNFKIVPWTGSVGTSSGTYKGYYGNDSNTANESTPAATVSPPEIITGLSPYVSRNASSNYTYSTTDGAWTNSPTSYSYQWYYYKYLPYPPYASYITISGATSSSYTSSSTYVGWDIYCIVTASNAAPTSGTATSNFVTITTATSSNVGNNKPQGAPSIVYDAANSTSTKWAYDVTITKSTIGVPDPSYYLQWYGSGNASNYVETTGPYTSAGLGGTFVVQDVLVSKTYTLYGCQAWATNGITGQDFSNTAMSNTA